MTTVAIDETHHMGSRFLKVDGILIEEVIAERYYGLVFESDRSVSCRIKFQFFQIVEHGEDGFLLLKFQLIIFKDSAILHRAEKARVCTDAVADLMVHWIFYLISHREGSIFKTIGQSQHKLIRVVNPRFLICAECKAHLTVRDLFCPEFRGTAESMLGKLVPFAVKFCAVVSAVSNCRKEQGRAESPDCRISLPDVFSAGGVFQGD